MTSGSKSTLKKTYQKDLNGLFNLYMKAIYLEKNFLYNLNSGWHIEIADTEEG